MAKPRLIAGAMTGTSADGVDVALVEITGRGLAMTARPLAHAHAPFPDALRRQILEVRQRGDVRLADLAAIGRAVALAHVPAFRAALARANVEAGQIAAIAAHGQTLFHAPPDTIQYFDPSLLAFETGCTVVSDFRRADLAAGGQGAPLVPFADWILFRHPTLNRVILNLGGIANLTYLKAGGAIDEVVAFDTGPGNCVSDWLMRDRGGVDENGARARQGRFSGPVLERALRDPFFKALPPKSTDGPAMIRAFETACADEALSREGASLSLDDALATSAAFTARTVADALPADVDALHLSGGGVRNAALVDAIRAAVGGRVGIIDCTLPLAGAGPAVDLAAAREAIAFALLAAATLDGEPSNVPSATGASRRVVLGSVTPKPS